LLTTGAPYDQQPVISMRSRISLSFCVLAALLLPSLVVAQPSQRSVLVLDQSSALQPVAVGKRAFQRRNWLLSVRDQSSAEIKAPTALRRASGQQFSMQGRETGKHLHQ